MTYLFSVSPTAKAYRG